MTEARHSAVDAALDLFVYLPVGLAITVSEELPKIAAKGRSRINTQVTMARVVGQFAVSRARQELDKRFGPSAPPAAPSPAGGTAPFSEERGHDAVAGLNGSASPGSPKPSSGSGSAPASEMTAEAAPTAVVVAAAGDLQALEDAVTAPAPPAHALAIPGYDSLSASQVVQRLAGLSAEELTAVEAYEQAHRGRRTILTRVNQLRHG